MNAPSEHPFAPYIRILGKGKRGSRSLSEAEAFEAMSMLLANEIEPEQLGAFLMLLRVKEETADELCGFARAVRAVIPGNQLTQLNVSLDWPSYAGKREQPPWYLLAAFALANSGVRILMHGASAHTPGRVYTEDALGSLGWPQVNDLGQLNEALDRFGFAYLPIELLAPELGRLMSLKPLFGLRSPVHSLCRLINPAASAHCVQSVFHPGYAPNHQQAARQLGTENCVIAKGYGGEFELRPSADTKLYRLGAGKRLESTIPRRFEREDIEENQFGGNISQSLRAIWKAENSPNDQYAVAAILATLQACLLATQPALSVIEAGSRAEELWNRRNPDFLDTLAAATI